MVFIETPVFTKRILEVLPDDEYKELQQEIAENPKKGNLIPGGGGLRKIRWSASGKGKRGGARVIYHWFVSDSIVLLLFVFKKNEHTDISKKQIKVLRTLVEKELK
jgi:mRNA-degrading endonuclease RelE of RelBE toxin-antitoxin system